MKYPVISNQAADLKRLRISLCGKDKMPVDFTFEGPMDLYDKYHSEDYFIGRFVVVVFKGTPARVNSVGRTVSSSKHRIFVRYCGRLIPAGRITQVR